MELEFLEIEKMYTNALKRLDLKESSTNEEAFKARRNKWAVQHPDKH